MVALVIDVGVWRSERGHMQNAAALAAASYLPDQAAKADSIAHATAIANSADGGLEHAVARTGETRS